MLCAVAFAAPAHADFGDYQSHALVGQSLLVQTDRGELRITAVDDAAFEVHYREDGVKQLPSFAIAGLPEAVRTTVMDGEDRLKLDIPGLTAVIEKTSLTIAYERDGEPLVAEEHGYFAFETVRGFRFRLNDEEKILGGGQRVLGMDRRGKRLPLYNRASYGYTTEAYQMYYSLPAVLSSEKYIIAFDNSASGWLDIANTEENILQFEAVGGRTSYIIAAGDSYPALVENFTDVTGRQPLLPRWALGNYASRFGYRDEKEARDVVRRFQRADIPLDAIILDIYWFGPDIQGHMGNLDWDRDAWPNAEDMIRDFASQGVRTIPITEPFVLTASKRWQDAVNNGAIAKAATGGPKTFNFYFGNTGLIDIFTEDGQRWFWRAYERLFEQGVGGTWGDLGEPEVHPGDTLHWLSDVQVQATGDEIHNAYGHVWAQTVYENQVRRYPDVRPVILMRSGFLGSQRYGMVPWTGDVSRSWGGLKPQVELTLQMGLLGLAWNHSDLGGFAGGEQFDKEMYIRWLQYGVFQPIYRPHAQEEIAPEPVFHDRETRRITRDYIRLRYALLPYLYTMAWENSTTGMPLMRPVFFEDESNLELIDEKDTYLWGASFLVSPVTDPGVESVDVNLPPGQWIDFFSGESHAGGQTVSVPVTLETIPVLVRAGSIIPMAEVVNTTEAYSTESLLVHYYADPGVTESSARMYEDDGKTRNSIASGAHELLYFDANRVEDRLVLGLRREGGAYEGRPEQRTITLTVHNWTTDVQSVAIAGRTIELRRKLRNKGESAAFDAEAKTLTVRFDWDHSDASLEIN